MSECCGSYITVMAYSYYARGAPWVELMTVCWIAEVVCVELVALATAFGALMLVVMFLALWIYQTPLWVASTLKQAWPVVKTESKLFVMKMGVMWDITVKHCREWHLTSRMFHRVLFTLTAARKSTFRSHFYLEAKRHLSTLFPRHASIDHPQLSSRPLLSRIG